MQLTDLFLRDGRQRVDGIEPCVESRLISQCLKACVLEIGLILDSVDVSDKLGSLWQNLNVIGAEIINVSIEVVDSGRVFGCHESRISQWPERSQQKVPRVEAGCDNHTI